MAVLHIVQCIAMPEEELNPSGLDCKKIYELKSLVTRFSIRNQSNVVVDCELFETRGAAAAKVTEQIGLNKNILLMLIDDGRTNLNIMSVMNCFICKMD